MIEPTIVIPLAGSVVAGGLIGLERELHNRPAGLRTHTLVCLASALMMLAAVRQAEWQIMLIPDSTIVTDPTRMAHGILTGIGFLCAGVIFREGFSIQGLTTASSLWLTSALGLLFGVGMHGLAIIGTLVTLVVLIGFRLFYRFLPRQSMADITILLRQASELPSPEVERRLAQCGLTSSFSSLRVLASGQTEYQLKITQSGDLNLSVLANALAGLPEISSYEVRFHEDVQ